jgi:hypothetical protein
MEKCILANQSVVKNILDGIQTQHRVLMRTQPDHCHRDIIGKSQPWAKEDYDRLIPQVEDKEIKPRWKPGDIICVRERARLTNRYPIESKWKYQFTYEADGSRSKFIEWPERIKKFPMNRCCPNGCFKELIRIKKTIKRVWVEQGKDISLDDIIAEGVEYDNEQGRGHLREKYYAMMKAIYPNWTPETWHECIEW